MFQLGFELSYPRLDASIYPLPVLPILNCQIKIFWENFIFKRPYIPLPFLHPSLSQFQEGE